MKEKPLVSITGKKGPFLNVKNALEALDLSSVKGKKVLIKPNFGRSTSPEKGFNTHPEAVAAVIEALQFNGASKIAIGESPLVGINTIEAFEKGGLLAVSKKYNVELIDFDSVPPQEVPIPDSRILKETRICSPVFDFDILVSVPVTKTHMHTGVTLGIKNFKGCLYRHEKVKYHQLEYPGEQYPEKTLDTAISDLAMVLMPHLTVVDGYIGMEGLGPSGGVPVKSDFALASWDAMGADVLGCLMMGLDAAEVPHLRLISERKGLSILPEDYKIIQDDYRNYIHAYRKPPKEISVDYKNVVVHDCESCSSCLSTLMLFLKRFQTDMSQYLLDDGNFHIAIGKGVENVKEGTVFIGNCTRKNKDKGIFVPGCPPVPTRIFEAITGEEPEENEPEVK